MERLKSNAVIYQALFLISFALFAHEKANLPGIKATFESPLPSQAIVEKQLPDSSELDEFYDQLKTSEIFRQKRDGLSLLKKRHAIKIVLQSDELYRDGEVAVEEAWYSLLDQMGDFLFRNPVGHFRYQFVAYANSESERESRGSAFQQSPFVFSAARAEWLFRYYESKYHFQSEAGSLLVAGGGLFPKGRRIEIQILPAEL